jgi:hypothetical protein
VFSNKRQQSTASPDPDPNVSPTPAPSLSPAVLALSFTIILIQVQAATYGSVRDLLPSLIAALLVIAGLTPSNRPES